MGLKLWFAYSICTFTKFNPENFDFWLPNFKYETVNTSRIKVIVYIQYLLLLI
jgi:hypothetical protein